MDKIRARDPDWEQLALRGLLWERLKWQIMLEKGACVFISNALNRKNSHAMETGAMEICRYMISLCKPYPQKTPYEPVRDRLI